MQPLFSGSIRQKRAVDLSGEKSASSISQARVDRLEREGRRQTSQAATLLQARHRGNLARRQTAAALSAEFDTTSLNKETIRRATQLLILSTRRLHERDVQRISKWARAVIIDKLLFLPFEEVDAREHWATILRLAAYRMLEVATKYPLAPQTALSLEIVKLIIDPSKYPTETSHYAQAICQTLISPPQERFRISKHEPLFLSIEEHILGVPSDNNKAASLISAISLALKALSTSSVNASTRSTAVVSFLQHILTTPLLSQRLPSSSLTSLTNSLPLPEILAIFQKSTNDINPTDALHLLVNMLPLVQPKMATFKSVDEFHGWTELIGLCLSHSSLDTIHHAYNSLRQQSKGKGKATENDMDVDEQLNSTSGRVENDPRLLAQLTTVSSQSHIVALLTLSSRFSSSPLSRPALAKCIVTLLDCLPAHAADEVRTTITYDSRHGGAGLIREIWRGWLRSSKLMKEFGPAQGKDGWQDVCKYLSQYTTRQIPATEAAEWHLLILLCHLYSRTLSTLGDDEFYPSRNSQGISTQSTRNPLPLEEIQSFSGLLRNIAFAMYWTGDVEADKLSIPGLLSLKAEDCRDLFRGLLVSIHERDSRRSFLPSDHFIMTSAFDVGSFIETAIAEDQRIDEIEEEEANPPPQNNSDSDSEVPSRGLSGRMMAHNRVTQRPAIMSRRRVAFLSPRLGVLNNIPFVIPFETRVSVFRQLVNNDRQKGQHPSNNSLFPSRSRGMGHMATIRRDHVAEDGFNALRNLGTDGLKGRLQIQFVDVYGQVESGIDGGGLFKEFLTSLSQEAFDTNRGLWRSNSRQEVYPAPHRYARESISLQWYRFLGQIVGKALYEGILVAIPFAGFFLSKWLGRVSYVDDLASLDPELYNGIVSLKTYQGDVRDLALTFALDEEDMGVSKTIDLIPGGREIAVTNENRHRYITLISHYRLNAQIREQSSAFVGGLHDIINPRWLRLFSQHELKVLVGGTEAAIDIDDLRANSVYAGIEESSETVRHFWSVLNEFDGEQRRAFVRFVTSADKAPLLGFGELQPHFAIRHGGTDESRLPTSSTCVNLLKLPAYSERSLLKQWAYIQDFASN